MKPTPRPFLKWAGGKTQLLPELRKHVPASFGTYHEPFLGGGALFFDLKPSHSVLSDANLILVRTYRGVKYSRDFVCSHVRDFLSAHSESEYYRHRTMNVQVITDPYLASWFIYINKTCFNGLYRVNSSGQFNVPFGRYASTPSLDACNIYKCSDLLGNSIIECRDFRNTEESACEGDFAYFDPPYIPVNNTSYFTSYTPGGFGMKDQVDLRDMALRLKRRGVHVLLSNSGVPAVAELYKEGFEIHEVSARRGINCDPDKRGKVKEFLIK